MGWFSRGGEEHLGLDQVPGHQSETLWQVRWDGDCNPGASRALRLYFSLDFALFSKLQNFR